MMTIGLKISLPGKSVNYYWRRFVMPFTGRLPHTSVRSARKLKVSTSAGRGGESVINRSICLLMGTWLLLCLGSPLGAQIRSAQDGTTEKARAGSEAATSPRSSVSDAEYKIGAQDVLRIDVWKEDQLTRTVPVRPDGQVTLPLLNDVQAAGLTPMDLASVISERLKKFINNPQVTVTITEINSRRIYVTGEVSRPGAFPLLPNMTVLQALSSSGGFTQFARSKNVYVLRVMAGRQVKLPFNYNDVVKGKKSEQNVLLEPGDVIVVP
jgi:polysaccharide export outer membrane protein